VLQILAHYLQIMRPDKMQLLRQSFGRLAINSEAPGGMTFMRRLHFALLSPVLAVALMCISAAAQSAEAPYPPLNYPLVRITNATGHVFYPATHGHSTMGVATGAKIVSTKFDVPSGIETGASKLVVIANGIPSASVEVTVK
jgi:hypothetical protein